jgi:hypothetical protein
MRYKAPPVVVGPNIGGIAQDFRPPHYREWPLLQIPVSAIFRPYWGGMQCVTTIRRRFIHLNDLVGVESSPVNSTNLDWWILTQ